MMGDPRYEQRRICFLRICILCPSFITPSTGFATTNFVNPKSTAAYLQRVSSSTSANKYFPRHSSLHVSMDYMKSSIQMASYSAPEDSSSTKLISSKLPQPKIGDIVRYFDVDGGRTDGQTLVGKISLIQPILPSSTSPSANNGEERNKWLVEITEMEDVGEGYFAEYPSRRRRRSALRKLEDIAPLPASFVRTENAYKVPMERGTNRPIPSHSSYDLIGYQGPMAVPINVEILQADGENYDKIKFSLLRNAAIAGGLGTIFAQVFRGTEDAIIYAAGALAGVGYLFFLGVKTDTVGSVQSKYGSSVSNVRFLLPVLVLIGVALRNTMSGDASPVNTPGMFDTVTAEQFGAAMIGFLTYRVPLFVSQLTPIFSESVSDIVPGSVSMVIRHARDANKRGVDASALDTDLRQESDLVTVLLVSGPEGTGKTTLVNKLLEDDPRFVRPIFVDRIQDGLKFERFAQRNEFLNIDSSGRFGLLKEGVLEAAAKATESSGIPKVVVVDADVELSKKLVNLSKSRLVGVWVGLDSLEKFESRLKSKIKSGIVPIPDGETEESVLRKKIRQVVKDIEFGVVSGIFEFTILNEDLDRSMQQLKEAAVYCFK